MENECFISYSRKNEDFVNEVRRVLEKEKIDYWLDTSSTIAGSDYSMAVVDAIERCKIFILIVSKDSMASRNVKSELNIAYNREKKIIPIIIDNAPLSKSFEYHLTLTQWIETFNKPVNWQERLLKAVHEELGTMAEKSNSTLNNSVKTKADDANSIGKSLNICSKCGAENPINGHFCQNCGAMLPWNNIYKTDSNVITPQEMYNRGASCYTKKKYSEAVECFRKAAEQGHAAAQNDLGDCYYYGKGVHEDYTEAVKWYWLAAKQGNVYAQYSLSFCCYNGKGVREDYTEAVKWCRKAAEQGYALAQYNLGVCYSCGTGVTKDYAEAVKWYRKAAEQGDALAQYSFGDCYYYGTGVTKDYVEAVKWYRKAAEQGHLEAKEKLNAITG